MAYLKVVILQICELLDYVILNINLSHILVSIVMSCQMSNFEQNEPFIVQNVIWKYFVPGYAEGQDIQWYQRIFEVIFGFLQQFQLKSILQFMKL